jgi:serine/threonine-protein kinase
MVGKLLEGRYQVIQVLSSGGFCQTYLAQDTHLPGHPTCVVKHLKPASNYPNSLQTLRWLFTGEAQALKKLGSHDRIPQLLAHLEENQEFYLVQEFIQGHPLGAELQPGQRWSESQVFQLLQEILEILQFIHSQGLIHRDIKPNNLLRRHQDNRLVLIDFGSVKQAWTQVITLQGQKINTFAIGLPATITIGTPGYMPTEQERGRPRPNSDIYALGIVGIQALTGLHPTLLETDADTCEVLWQHHCRVSAELAEILNKMVRYSFKDRYQSATEVLEALKPLAILYPPTQPVEFFGQQVTSAQLAQTATQKAQTPLYEQETLSYIWSDRAEPLQDGKTSHKIGSTPTKKSASAIDIGIAVIAAIALVIGIYYSLRSPAPAGKPEKYPVSIPLKSDSL